MKNAKKPILNIILIIISIFLILFTVILDGKYTDELILGISAIINLYVIISSILSIKKGRSISSIVFLIISFILFSLFSFATIDGAISNIKRDKYLKSEENYISYAESLERSLNDSAKEYYDLEYFINNSNISEVVVTKSQAEEKFDEKLYKVSEKHLGTCDGYTIINIDQENIKKFNSVTNYDYEAMRTSISTKSFVSCKDKYTYETKGYDSKYLNSNNVNSYNFDDVYGSWLTTGNSYFQFSDNNSFYWWKDSNDLNDNYYKGNIEILRGNDALMDLGITYDRVIDVIVNSKGQVIKDDIYSLKLKPTYLISGGVDKTKTNIKEDTYFKLMFIRVSDTEAQAYNYNTGDTYYLTKKN